MNKTLYLQRRKFTSRKRGIETGKMIKILVFITVLTIIAGTGEITFCQGTGSLRGTITDTTSGEVIIYANVIIQGTTHGSPTDTRGYYFIPAIPAGKHTVIISHLNYQSRKIEVLIKAGQITQLDVQLKPSNIKFREVPVIGKKSARPTETDLGLEKISIREVQMMPKGLEADIFRAIQTSTGVSSTGDVTGQYYVRGGGGDQNLVLFNGATIYYPFHALGILSVIDPEMISTLEFYKGGFQAEYGGRLSSILNIVTKDGNKNEYHGVANASFLSGKLAVEGPIPNGSFIATVRKSYYAQTLKKYLNNKDVPFDFYDAAFKVNYSNPSLSSFGKFVGFGFISRDNVNYDDPLREDYSIGNTVFGLNWYKIWSSPLFSFVTISYSGFDAKVEPNLSQSLPRSNKISDVTFDWHFTYIYNTKDELTFGFQNKFLHTNLSMINVYGSQTNFDQAGWDLTIFGDYKFYRWEKVGLQLGLRAKFKALTEGRPYFFEPRISLTYHPNNVLTFKAALGRYSQQISTLSNEDELISIFKPWIITPDGLGAAQATDFILGVDTYLNENFNITLDGYYKIITDLLEVNDRKYSSIFSDYMNVDGKAYGLEFTAKYQIRNLFAKASYSFGRAFQIKGDEMYAPRYDVRHSVNLMIGAQLGKGWSTSANWALRSGMPFTPIAGFYERPDLNPWSGSPMFDDFIPTVHWGARNSHRLPFYHRLDLSLTKDFQLSFAKISVGANVTNVYNRQNIFYFDKTTGEKIYMLPFFPSLSIRAEI